MSLAHDDDAEILAAAREGFLVEAREQLQAFESALLVMESDPADTENLNAAFRAAHTIKGTAGLFGCDAVAAFTHEVETLMEALRSKQRAISAEISATLLESLDQISHLLDEVDRKVSSPEVAAMSQRLGERLRALCAPGGSTTARAPDRADGPAAAAAAEAPEGGPAVAAGAALWHLSLRFGVDALRNGLDPMAFLRYLGKFGEVRGLHLLDGAVPALDVLDPESCHLGFELCLDSSAHPATDRAAIEQVFEFAVEDARIAILEPDAPASAREALLAERCGDDESQRAQLLALWQALGVAAPAASSTDEGAAVRPDTLSSPAGEMALADAAARHERHPEDGAERRAANAPADRRQGEADRREGQRERRGGGADERYVRVRADKLDRLIDIIGELVIAGSGVQSAAEAERAPLCQEAARRVADLVEEARDGALALRMVPVGETFARFHRVVRDVSKQLGKEVELVISGGDTELDKSMVDVIADPLTHLVRNSLDHGIEPTAERLAAGKPAKGRLALHAHHEAGAIVIEVGDDGRGLVRERILAKAVERGLVAADAALSDAEVWRLIFAPGFSTAEQVTNVSGRGVGMDVVKRNVEALRGEISIVSTPGQGTTMQLRLPLTLAIIDGFLTQVGKVHYVIPLAAVAECIDLPAECRDEDGRRPVSGTFDLRGDILPWLDLARYYGQEPAPGATTVDGTDTNVHRLAARRSLVLVRSGTQRIGLVVDRLLGEHQTVIKPLAGIFKPLKALAGSTILGSGEVALVLDMPGLVSSASHGSGAHDLAMTRNATRAAA